MSRRLRGYVGAAVLVAIGASADLACSASANVTGPNDAGADAAPLSVIQLVQNPWDASRLDAAIAQILLGELGVAATITEIDEYKQWARIQRGEMHASFEVWPSGHAQDITTYIDTAAVENGGLLGPVGKISWYVPTYLLTTSPALDAWTAYKDPTNTAAFATPQTGSKGQFLSGDPTWTQYDADIIRNLGLNLQVVVAGTEAAELAQLDSVYSRRGAILMYLWTPHAALAKYDLTAVALPPYDPAEYSNAADGGVGCDYPADHLFKIFWPGLKAASPKVYQLLKNITFTNEEQIELLGQVDNQGSTIQEAAQGWVAANKAVWQAWLP